MRRAAKIDAPKYLGRLCKFGHNHEGTGKSLRKRSDRACVVCCRIRALAKYHADPVAYSATRDKVKQREYQARWRRERRAADPVAAREVGRQRYARSPLLIRLRTRLRKAFLASLVGKSRPSCEYADFMAIVAHLGPCPGPLSEWHIDHIRPLSSFDFSDIEQVRAAFHPSNHQWLPATENLRKNNKYG